VQRDRSRSADRSEERADDEGEDEQSADERSEGPTTPSCHHRFDVTPPTVQRVDSGVVERRRSSMFDARYGVR
jgi:hypothetical protein